MSDEEDNILDEENFSKENHITSLREAQRRGNLMKFEKDYRVATIEPPCNDNALATISQEIGGVKGLEPTRYGDWQHKGKVTDF